MKRKLSKKAWIAIISTALALTLAVTGTVAWLMDSSDSVVNTFNDNKVEVDLTETTGQEYNILPGTYEHKDPKVTVTATTQAYVFVEVIDNTQGLVSWEIAPGWTALDGIANVYYRIVEGSPDPQEFQVLAGNTEFGDGVVTYDGSLTNQQIKDGKEAAEAADPTNGISLTFTAHAIQTTGFEGPAQAYGTIVDSNNPNPNP